jgi:hypothetical protein
MPVPATIFIKIVIERKNRRDVIMRNFKIVLKTTFNTHNLFFF